MKKVELEREIINTVMLSKIRNYNQPFFFMVDKSYLSEYISNNSSQDEELHMQKELLNITQKDEMLTIKYLLDIMRTHGIITEEEYQAVLYKYI